MQNHDNKYSTGKELVLIKWDVSFDLVMPRTLIES